MKKKFLVFFITIFIFQIGKSVAQASLMDDISRVYLEKLIATAKENYPLYSTYKSRINIAQSNVISQKSNWLDGLSFSYVYKPNNTLDIVNPTFFNGYQVAVQFSVTELFQKSSNVRQAKEALKIAYNEQGDYNQRLTTEVRVRYLNYLNQKRVVVSQTSAYASALDIHKDFTAKFLRGEVTLTEFNQSKNSLNSIQQGMWSAENSFEAAKAMLEELTVKPLEEIQ